MIGRRARRMMGPGRMVGVSVDREAGSCGWAAGRSGWACMFLVSEVNFSFSKVKRVDVLIDGIFGFELRGGGGGWQKMNFKGFYLNCQRILS